MIAADKISKISAFFKGEIFAYFIAAERLHVTKMPKSFGALTYHHLGGTRLLSGTQGAN